MKIIQEKQDGLTLLEVILAMSILGIFAISFSTMLGNGLTANQINQERLDGLLVAQNCMELVKSETDIEGFTVTNCSNTMNNKLFNLSIDVSSSSNLIDPNSLNKLYEVTITVDMDTGSPIEITTQLFRP
ncbi:type IV pilus modification PilV family protein [Bacillus sp. FJAT-45350]|uniref:type IV pilus modification PilV family protein n=1 Tax=Bacillus sp. FJAT-45350 TaxID=2011014 RepID=UPI000BB86D60|nr:prepilin-type N-terminal cleavage/methylation domain-containing protein [Bacillus sp. FJAT-45350]